MLDIAFNQTQEFGSQHTLSSAGLLNADYRNSCIDFQCLHNAGFKRTGNIR